MGLINFKKKRRSDELRILFGVILMLPISVYLLIGGPFWMPFDLPKSEPENRVFAFSFLSILISSLVAGNVDRYSKEVDKASASLSRTAFLVIAIIIYLVSLSIGLQYSQFATIVIVISASVGWYFVNLVKAYISCREYWQKNPTQETVK